MRGGPASFGKNFPYQPLGAGCERNTPVESIRGICAGLAPGGAA